MTQPTTAPVPDFKIRVIDEDHSRAIQEELFKRGVKWRSGHTDARHMNCSALYCEDSRILQTAYADDYYEKHRLPEHTFTNGKFSFDKEEAQPDADGWIEWKGWECPVEAGVTIDVKFRAGTESNGCIPGYRWTHEGWGGDIVAYRVHKPKSDSVSIPTEAITAATITCDKLKWRGTPEQGYFPDLQPKKEWQKDRLLDVLKEMARLVEQSDYDTVYDLLTDEAAQLINDLKWK